MFYILRRKPIPVYIHNGFTFQQGYDISFLITDEHLLKFSKDRIIDFLVQFLEEIDKNLSQLKLSVNSRTRAFATEFVQALAT